jgi:hypothetical protein
VSASNIQFTQAPASQSIILIQSLISVSSGSVGTFSGSFIGTATTASYVLPSGLPAGVISSSAQIDIFLDLDGVYSSSAQVLTAISGAVITPSTITASGHIVPSTTDIYDLGSPDKKWRSLYVSGSTIYLGTLQLKDNGGNFTVVNQSGDNLPISGAFTGSFFGTSSWASNALTASRIDYTNIVNKPTLVSASVQIDAFNTTNGTRLATTGSNTFNGNQIISGTLNVSSGITGSFFGTSSWAQNAVTASYISGGLNIPNGLEITGSLSVTGGITGSLFGTSSWANNAISSSYATTASFASNVLKTKAGSVANTSFGGTPLTASVTFSAAFDNTNYAIAITGEDSRAWVVQSKTASGFVINSVSNTAITGTTYWTCTAYGEN